MNKTVKSVLWLIITFVLLELLLLSALELIILFSEVKLGMTADVVLSTLGNLFTNLPSVISTYISERNPIFIIGTIIILIYSLILTVKGHSKKSEWETQSEGYHGSAKWSKPREIFDNKNFESQSKSEIARKFQQSLKS